MKPWMLDNTSSASLRGMEIGLPPGHRLPVSHKLPPPPDAAVTAYETKPLPPIPTRRSGISSFSIEVQNAFRTPTSAGYHIPEVNPYLRESSIAVTLGTDSDTTGQVAEGERGHTFTETRAQDIHSLIPPGSVQKVLQITGAGSVASLALTNTSLTPSGHNSTRKIRQMMGVEVYSDESHRARSPAQNVSPLTIKSCSSSIYSQDQDDTVSELDDIVSHEREQFSTPEISGTLRNHLEPASFWRPSSLATSAVPASLHIVKTKDSTTVGQDHGSLNQPASSTTNNYSHANGAFKQDLYHVTVTELAQSTSSFAYSQASGNSDRQERTNLSHPGIYIGQPPQIQTGFSNRSYQSKVRIAPPLSKLDTLSATRYNAPVKTPYPLPVGKYEFDDDDHTPTQNDYDSGFSPTTAAKRPSLMTRIIRHTSSPLSPVNQSTPAPELTPSFRAHTSTLLSPGPLKAPPLLKHRPVKSQEILASHNTTVFPDTSTNYTASTSRTGAHLSQDCTAPVSRTATPMPQNYNNPTINGATPIPVAPSQNRTRSPPVPPRCPPSLLHTQPIKPKHTSKPSLAEAAARNLAAWAGKTVERIEQAREAAGIRTRSQRRRSKLKSKITLMGLSRLEADPPPPDSVLKKDSDEKAVPGSGTAGAAPLFLGRGLGKYSDEKAWAAVRNMI